MVSWFPWFPWFLEWYPGVSGYLVGVPGNLSLVEVVTG